MAKEHKKLYKAGKNWLVATLFAVAAGTALATTSVHADTTDQGQPVATDTVTNKSAVIGNSSESNTDKLADAQTEFQNAAGSYIASSNGTSTQSASRDQQMADLQQQIATQKQRVVDWQGYLNASQAYADRQQAAYDKAVQTREDTWSQTQADLAAVRAASNEATVAQQKVDDAKAALAKDPQVAAAQQQVTTLKDHLTKMVPHFGDILNSKLWDQEEAALTADQKTQYLTSTRQLRIPLRKPKQQRGLMICKRTLMPSIKSLRN